MRAFSLLTPLVAVLAALIACGDAPPADDGASTWFATCGDPVCNTYSGPTDGLATCADEGVAEGDACSELDATCDLEDDCNRRLICATEDPVADGMCPKSRKAHKRDIAYLDAEARAAVSEDLLAMRLATWRYRGTLDDGAVHLGFLIDDVPGSPAVRADGEHVDLYGYVSLAVATIQEQHAHIAAQQQRIDLLEKRLAALEQGQASE